MPQGKPDWGVNWSPRTLFGLDDLGEHAARVKSPVVWDRRGDVVLVDNFDAGISLGTVYAGIAGDHVQLWGSGARSGIFSIIAHAGGGVGNMAGMYYEIGIPTVTAFGFEFSFGIEANCHFVRWVIEHNDGTFLWRGAVQYNWVLRQLEYLDNLGRWIPFALGVDASDFARPGNTGKLVVDYSTNTYIHFRMNAGQYGLVRIPLNRADAILTERMSFWGVYISQIATEAESQMDSFIITHNEPL